MTVRSPLRFFGCSCTLLLLFHAHVGSEWPNMGIDSTATLASAYRPRTPLSMTRMPARGLSLPTQNRHVDVECHFRLRFSSITTLHVYVFKLYVTINLICMTYNMIPSVHISTQGGCPAFLECYQRPRYPLGGVRVQNPCMLKVCSRLDTPTKSAMDIIMCPQVVRGVYLGTHLPLGLVQ